MKNVSKIALLLLVASPVVLAAEPPRWGEIRYDLNTLEYVVPKCEHSRIKLMAMKREDGRVVIRLECEPVKGEVNLPNPDLHKE